jgi:membrane-bound ClpP family serine protease
VAALCLFLIILSSYALEAINRLEVIFLVTGALILLVELFVLPTFGFLGFVGIVFFLMGLFGLMIPGLGAARFEFDTQTFNAAGEFVLHRLGILAATLLLALLIIALLARYVMPRFGAYRRFVLSGGEQVGYIAGENPATLPQPGTKGKAMSTLRPSGKIEVDGVIYDAMSSGDFIEQDATVVVSRLEGSVIIVEKL